MLVGLVGKPSCGKSTFFKAATLMDVLIAAYPFATIKPNTGVGYVRVKCLCKDFNTRCNPRTGNCNGETRFVPVELMDVAGLIEGASEGKGLGNQFLNDLSRANAFIHIVDISATTDAEGKECTPDKGNPVKDIAMLENELDLWYLGILNKVWGPLVRKLAIEKTDLAKAIAKQFSGLDVNEDDVKIAIRKLNLNPEKATTWSAQDLRNFAHEIRHMTKPMIIAANKIDKPGAKEWYDKLKAEFPHLLIIPCSADSELSLRQAAKAGMIDYTPGNRDFKMNEEKLNDKQKAALKLIKENILDKFNEGTGVQAILDATVFSLLNYIAVFPAGATKLADSKGNVLPDCFLVPRGTTALQFAFKLHTDLGKNFVKAINAKTKQAIGKDHVLEHRDGVEIITR
ncbi:Ribosome-binding ATPase YchF [uncultured archaeon]|nr:Ribosome-binding ATPase YchF [uncultured archaeon]